MLGSVLWNELALRASSICMMGLPKSEGKVYFTCIYQHFQLHPESCLVLLSMRQDCLIQDCLMHCNLPWYTKSAGMPLYLHVNICCQVSAGD